MIRLPIAWKTGRAFSSAEGSPPTKKVNVPSFAPFWPPDTGASRKAMPRSESLAAMSRAASAAMVEVSITIAPRAAPPTVPRSPRWTSSTCGASGTEETMTSLARPTSAGSRTARAPGTSRANASAFSKCRVATVSRKPAFARFLAMPWPMVPRPIKPTDCCIRRLAPGL